MGLLWPSSDNPYGSWPLIGLLGTAIAVCIFFDAEYRHKFLRVFRSYLVPSPPSPASQTPVSVVAAAAASLEGNEKQRLGPSDFRAPDTNSSNDNNNNNNGREGSLIVPPPPPPPPDRRASFEQQQLDRHVTTLRPLSPPASPKSAPVIVQGDGISVADQSVPVQDEVLHTSRTTTGHFDAILPQQRYPPSLYVRQCGLDTPESHSSVNATRIQTPDIEDSLMFSGATSITTTTTIAAAAATAAATTGDTSLRSRRHNHISLVAEDDTMRVDRSFGYIDNSNRELVFKINAVDNEGVAAAPTSAIPTSPTDSAAEVDHILFVCTKCQRKKLKESCEEVCGQNYLKCRLGNLLNSDEFCDMEDMIVPMTPSYEDDGRRKKTGRILYENLKGLYEQSERLKARAACHGDPQHSHHDLRRGEINCPNAVQPRLKIVPVDCLSYCDYANVVALAAPNKFQYQVAKIREDDPEDIEALLEFAESYLENEEDGFTKSKTRPNRLKGKVVARIPPLKPDFRNRAFD